MRVGRIDRKSHFSVALITCYFGLRRFVYTRRIDLLRPCRADVPLTSRKASAGAFCMWRGSRRWLPLGRALESASTARRSDQAMGSSSRGGAFVRCPLRLRSLGTMRLLRSTATCAAALVSPARAASSFRIWRDSRAAWPRPSSCGDFRRPVVRRAMAKTSTSARTANAMISIGDEQCGRHRSS